VLTNSCQAATRRQTMIFLRRRHIPGNGNPCRHKSSSMREQEGSFTDIGFSV